MQNLLPHSNRIEKISASMVLDYMNCPLSFYYHYIAKIQLPTKAMPLVFGNGIHAGIDAFYSGKDPYEAFLKNFDKSKLSQEELPDYERHVFLGQQMLEDYVKEAPLLDSLYNLKEGTSEKYFKKHLVNPLTKQLSSLPFTGRIDRLTVGNRIIEYKTASSKKPGPEEYRLQTNVYSLWYYSEFGKFPEEVVFIVLLKKERSNEEEKLYQVFTMHPMETELASTFDDIELIIQKINAAEFPRHTSFIPWCDCKKCDELLGFNENNT